MLKKRSGSLGPAIVSGDYHCLWVYFIATVLGVIVSVLTYKAVFEKVENEEKIVKPIKKNSRIF